MKKCSKKLEILKRKKWLNKKSWNKSKTKRRKKKLIKRKRNHCNPIKETLNKIYKETVINCQVHPSNQSHSSIIIKSKISQTKMIKKLI